MSFSATLTADDGGDPWKKNWQSSLLAKLTFFFFLYVEMLIQNYKLKISLHNSCTVSSPVYYCCCWHTIVVVVNWMNLLQDWVIRIGSNLFYAAVCWARAKLRLLVQLLMRFSYFSLNWKKILGFKNDSFRWRRAFSAFNAWIMIM